MSSTKDRRKLTHCEALMLSTEVRSTPCLIMLARARTADVPEDGPLRRRQRVREQRGGRRRRRHAHLAHLRPGSGLRSGLDSQVSTAVFPKGKLDRLPDDSLQSGRTADHGMKNQGSSRWPLTGCGARQAGPAGYLQRRGRHERPRQRGEERKQRGRGVLCGRAGGDLRPAFVHAESARG